MALRCFSGWKYLEQEIESLRQIRMPEEIDIAYFVYIQSIARVSSPSDYWAYNLYI